MKKLSIVLFLVCAPAFAADICVMKAQDGASGGGAMDFIETCTATQDQIALLSSPAGADFDLWTIKNMKLITDKGYTLRGVDNNFLRYYFSKP